MIEKHATEDGYEYAVVDDDGLRELGWTDEEIAQLAADEEAYDKGEWPDAVEEVQLIKNGRPTIFARGSTTFPFRLDRVTADEFDEKAAARGMTRSEALREAVDLWLRTA